VDDLEEVGAGFSSRILSQIGELLHWFANVNAVVMSIRSGPVLQLTSTTGRPLQWISLRRFMLEESLPTLELDRFAGCREAIKQCVSDVGGHPRGL
jgi:hypothetical protein